MQTTLKAYNKHCKEYGNMPKWNQYPPKTQQRWLKRVKCTIEAVEEMK